MPILSCSHDAYALFSEEFNGKEKKSSKNQKIPLAPYLYS
jgi:hypothetical protein